MKLERKTLITLLVGIIIGAAGVGLLNAIRPEPLKSSAYEELDASGKSCKNERAELDRVEGLYRMNKSEYNIQKYEAALKAYNNCSSQQSWWDWALDL